MMCFPRFWTNHSWCRNKWYLIWKPKWFSLENKPKWTLSHIAALCIKIYLVTQGPIPEIFAKKYWELAYIAGKWFFFDFWLHIRFFKKKNCCFFPMKISLAFIWGIIYFCTMDGFFRILENTSSELICTWPYVLRKCI